MIIRKLSVLIIIVLLYISSVAIINNDLIVKASSGSGEEGDIGLNFTYVKYITGRLSDVIKDVYNETELAKGRYFGSKGEQYAAEKILAIEMESIGLWDPTDNTTLPYLDQIENLEAKDYLNKLFPPYLNLTSHIEILDRGLTIVNRTNPSNTTYEEVIDCYISQFWNGSVLWNLSFYYDKHLLTYNFSFENLSIYKKPSESYYFTTENTTWFDNFINDTAVMENITTNTSIYDARIA